MRVTAHLVVDGQIVGSIPVHDTTIPQQGDLVRFAGNDYVVGRRKWIGSQEIELNVLKTLPPVQTKEGSSFKDMETK